MHDTTSRTRFFVATHKPWPLPTNPLYTAIALGGYRPEGDSHALSDAGGDNIADLNPHYSELTGWYWIWKNVRHVDLVGLCHYRRYFYFHTQSAGFHLDKVGMEPTPENMAGLFAPDPLPLVARHCRKNGVIVPRPAVFPESISSQYARNHRRRDWEAFLHAIAETSPVHARRMHLFDTERRMYLYNMMVAPWAFFDEYMSILMAVLEKVESLISYPDDPYQKRIPAFLAERLFTLHLLTVNPELWEVPIVLTDMKAN